MWCQGQPAETATMFDIIIYMQKMYEPSNR